MFVYVFMSLLIIFSRLIRLHTCAILGKALTDVCVFYQNKNKKKHAVNFLDLDDDDDWWCFLRLAYLLIRPYFLLAKLIGDKLHVMYSIVFIHNQGGQAQAVRLDHTHTKWISIVVLCRRKSHSFCAIFSIFFFISIFFFV